MVSRASTWVSMWMGMGTVRPDPNRFSCFIARGRAPCTRASNGSRYTYAMNAPLPAAMAWSIFFLADSYPFRFVS